MSPGSNNILYVSKENFIRYTFFGAFQTTGNEKSRPIYDYDSINLFRWHSFRVRLAS